MKSNSFAPALLALVLSSLACNLATQAETATPTIDLTTEANSILATGFAQLTAAAPASTSTSTPTSLSTETPTPLAALPPLATAIPTNTFIPTATNTSAPNIPDWPLFRLGDQGPEVRAIQHLLRFKGLDIDVDGIFGPQTRATVLAFQNQNGLGADGIVGPQTWTALIQGGVVQEGSTSQAVRAAQSLLRNKFGYSIEVDGIFGQQTENATRDFQTTHGLTVDGIIGQQTWRALVAIQP